MMDLTEDSLYRRSTQFRNWSFSTAQLADQRRKTNIQARERVEAAVAHHRTQQDNKLETAPSSTNESTTSKPLLENEVIYLTMAEEERLVEYYCEKALELGNFLEFPIDITATGIHIVQTSMFLANKIGRHSLSAEQYAALVGRNTTAKSILASEYLVLQSLRFNLEVKHPFRGLKGGNLELLATAHGNASPIPSCDQTPAEMQQAMLALPSKPSSPSIAITVPELEKRITNAYIFASHILKTTALLADVYFLYAPSHIWFSAHLLADEPLTLFYLSTKVDVTSLIYTKTLTTIRSCASLLVSHWTFTSEHTQKQDKEARGRRSEDFKALVKKNKLCTDLGKTSLAELKLARKKNPPQADGELEGSEAKKRKSEEEISEG